MGGWELSAPPLQHPKWLSQRGSPGGRTFFRAWVNTASSMPEADAPTVTMKRTAKERLDAWLRALPLPPPSPPSRLHLQGGQAQDGSAGSRCQCQAARFQLFARRGEASCPGKSSQGCAAPTAGLPFRPLGAGRAAPGRLDAELSSGECVAGGGYAKLELAREEHQHWQPVHHIVGMV